MPSSSRYLKDLALRILFPLDHALARIALGLFGDRPGIVCLMFHRLAPNPQVPKCNPCLHLGLEQLRMIIQHFREAQYHFLGLDDLEGPLDPQGRYVMLTFDDGNASDLEALKLLEAEGVPGSFFITTGRLASAVIHPQDFQSPLDAEGLRVLGSHPLAHIGNHGHTHHPMSELTEEALADEITRSRTLLAEVPRNNARALAFPSGAWNRRVFGQLTDMDFRWLFIVKPGRLTLAGTHIKGAIFPRWGFRADVSVIAQCRVVRASSGLWMIFHKLFPHKCRPLSIAMGRP